MWLPLRSFTRPLSSAPRGPLIRRLAAVDSLQRRYTALEEETIRKQRALQLQLREAAAELQVRRQEIVSGSAEPTDAEVTSSDAFFSGREPDEPEDLAGAVGIPGFWKGCGRRHPRPTPRTTSQWLHAIRVAATRATSHFLSCFLARLAPHALHAQTLLRDLQTLPTSPESQLTAKPAPAACSVGRTFMSMRSRPSASVTGRCSSRSRR